MKIEIKQLGTGFNLEATSEDGQKLLMDSARESGGTGKGMRPMQLVLAALGGCSAIDVISILKKQKINCQLEIEVEGIREKKGDYSLFREICLCFKFLGRIDSHKAERAIKLSLDKYCSVAKTLEPTARIIYKIVINQEDGKTRIPEI